MYLRSTTAGKVTLEIEDLRVGGNASTVRVTLIQNGKDRITGFVSYVHPSLTTYLIGSHRNTDMHAERGFSAETGYILSPPPSPAQVAQLANGTDPNWIGWTYPWYPKSFLKASTHFRFFFPIDGGPHPSITDVWLTPVRSSDAFTTEMLGCVADNWHRMVENYRPNAAWSIKKMVARAMQVGQDSSTDVDRGRTPVPYSYPTLSLSLEIKKLLPAQGVKWLLIRAEAKEIKNGRMDAAVTIVDENLELVAVSQQVSFIVDLVEEAKKAASHKEGKL